MFYKITTSTIKLSVLKLVYKKNEIATQGTFWNSIFLLKSPIKLVQFKKIYFKKSNFDTFSAESVYILLL